jgi:catechol 2,3-dioxygenase-like lactoylglutathione lyase family enzyme
MTAIGRLRSIVLECRDPEPLAEFWSAVLDEPVVQRDDDWWALAERPDGSRLTFQVVDDYEAPPWPGAHGEQQIHLDIRVDDISASAPQVVALGARQLTDVIDEGEGAMYQVFADPSGHPFCLVT